MTLVVLLGGVRSGKSQLALRLAEESRAPVVFLATGEAGDEEMTERIARHRRERPATWVTVEEPLELARAIDAVEESATLVVDCLSLWVSNLMHADRDVEAEAALAGDAASRRSALTIVVSNEVGLGVVPVNPLARRYRDELGRVNTLFADRADRACFVIAGKALELG